MKVHLENFLSTSKKMWLENEWTSKGGERQACDSKMKVESDGLSLTFGHTSMTIFPQLAHKPSFQPTFLFKKEKEINFGWKEVACGEKS